MTLVDRVKSAWAGWFGQLVRFGLIGVVNTAFSYAVYTLGVWLGLYAPLSWVIGYALGMVLSLTLNTRWTFRQRSKLDSRQVLWFVLVNIVSLGVSTGIVALLTEQYIWDKQWAGVAAAPASMVVNFIGNRLLVYKGRAD